MTNRTDKEFTEWARDLRDELFGPRRAEWYFDQDLNALVRRVTPYREASPLTVSPWVFESVERTYGIVIDV